MELSSLAGSIEADPARLGGCAMVGGWPVDTHQGSKVGYFEIEHLLGCCPSQLGEPLTAAR